MANNISHNYAIEIASNVMEVNNHLVGRSLIDGLRRTFTFTTGHEVEQGDFFMDRSRGLLEAHLQMLRLNDQNTIRSKYDKVRDLRANMDNPGGSKFQKYVQARKYRRLSRDTYRIIRIASGQAIDDRLMNQIAEATRLQGGGGSGSGGFGTGTVASNPFSDSHAISVISDVNVHDLEQVEMTTYRDETSNQAAVVLEMVARDDSVEHVVASFPTEAISQPDSQSTASAPAAISSHRDDGSIPRFISTEDSEQREDEQGMNKRDSFESGAENRPHAELRGPVCPSER